MQTLIKAQESQWREDADPKDRLAVALDLPNARLALEMVDRLDGTCRWFKVGMELYYAAGNSIIEELRGRGHQVFLDLKLHDIPNTVAGAVRSVAQTGASLLTVHACGGTAMMSAAAEAARDNGTLRLLAVTVLTSVGPDDLRSVGVAGSAEEQVMRLAALVRESGIDGMVCSPQEVAALRAEGRQTMLVTPGIRASGETTGDQKRIASAGDAIRRGASMLVVGRPITTSENPSAAAQTILREIAEAQNA